MFIRGARGCYQGVDELLIGGEWGVNNGWLGVLIKGGYAVDWGRMGCRLG